MGSAAQTRDAPTGQNWPHARLAEPGADPGERIEGTAESDRSRVVSLDPGTVDVLKAHRKRQAADKLKVGKFWKDAEDGYVFTTGWREPRRPLS